MLNREGAETNISIHALREEGDSSVPHRQTTKDNISIHALREEGDGFSTADQETATIFLSTPSARRATVPILPAAGVLQNFYPRPPRGGRPPVWRYRLHSSLHFYPRPPRGGRRSSGRERSAAPNFYPRPPRGGRPRGKLRACGRGDFYPRPPRGGRLIRRFSSALSNNFYPRPPRGGRHPLWTIPNLYTKFLSTPSARRATLCRQYVGGGGGISIHALREEGDP